MNVREEAKLSRKNELIFLPTAIAIKCESASLAHFPKVNEAAGPRII